MGEENHDIMQGGKSTYIEKAKNVTVNYGEKKIPKNLTKPPFLPEVFIGRVDDIKAVHEKLFKDTHLLLLVNGEGGIGKTTLAAHYYHTFQNDYQHLAWVFAESSLLEALLILALSLQMNFPEHLPAQQRLDGLLAKMADLEKPCLLVIDNANHLQDLEDYYQALSSCPNFHIMLTTRITTFEQAASYKIGSLETDDAMALFKKYYARHQADENPLLENILTAVGYNTLVIELLAKNLNQLNRLKTHYTLANLLSDLQHHGLLALNSQVVTSTYHADGSALRKETPESLIAAMYDLGELSDAETALLSVFAVLPAESITYASLETLLPGVENLESILLNLAQKGWLDNETATAFKVSPVVQEITRQKNQERLLQDNQHLIDSLIENLFYEPGTGHFINASYEDAALYARYGENVVHYISETADELAILCERLGNFHQTTGNLDRALGFFEEYSRIEKALTEAYPDNVAFKNGLAISYSKLGETHTALGDLDRALGFFEERSRIGKELNDAYPDNVAFKNGLAISYEKLGTTHTALGHLDRALGFFEKDMELTKALTDAYPNNVAFNNVLAISYIKLGDIYEKSENKPNAKEYYLLSQELLTQLAISFPQYVEFKKNQEWVENKLSAL